MRREVLRRLRRIARMAPAHPPHDQDALSRTLWTRMLDAFFSAARRRLPWLHWAGSALSALGVYLYALPTAWTSRLRVAGTWGGRFPDSSVLAVWHGCAPSLLVAAMRRRPKKPLAILVSTDARGDFLTLLCRLLGLRVVRGDSRHQPLEALARMAATLRQGGSAVITADGWGPARRAKRGALMLASAAGARLVPVGADCRPAFSQGRKWDASRTPLPLSRVAVVFGEPRRCPCFREPEELEEARRWLEEAIEDASRLARLAVRE